MASIQVILLVSSVELSSFAQQVSTILSKDYQIQRVHIRSAHTPVDRLMQAVHASSADVPVLAVVVGPSTASTSVLESEGSVPVVNLPQETSAPSLQSPSEAAFTVARYASLSSSHLRQRVSDTVKTRRQGCLIHDATQKTMSSSYMLPITQCIDNNQQITGDKVNIANRLSGKVRDRYVGDNYLALVTTDRQSGFDRQLAQVPFKGAVLNLTSAFWFEATRDIIPNHLISVPHPYVSIVKKCKPFPIEFVVR
jgi:SAICAR synthetase